MKKILLVEDEVHVVSFINKGLSEEGYAVTVALDGKTGLSLAEQNNFDIIILDIMLPEMNGLEVCKAIRVNDTRVPILMLTALGTSENIVLGLNTGADDYLVKPFKFIELVARIKTLLRRSNDQAGSDNNSNPEEQESIYSMDTLVLNDFSKKVTRDGKELQLTSTEYRLLLYFFQNKNKVLSRMEILEKVWGIDFNTSTNVVDVYVNYLRKKIEPYDSARLVHTVIGMGYVLKEES